MRKLFLKKSSLLGEDHDFVLHFNDVTYPVDYCRFKQDFFVLCGEHQSY